MVASRAFRKWNSVCSEPKNMKIYFRRFKLQHLCLVKFKESQSMVILYWLIVELLWKINKWNVTLIHWNSHQCEYSLLNLVLRMHNDTSWTKPSTNFPIFYWNLVRQIIWILSSFFLYFVNCIKPQRIHRDQRKQSNSETTNRKNEPITIFAMPFQCAKLRINFLLWFFLHSSSSSSFHSYGFFLLLLFGLK